MKLIVGLGNPGEKYTNNRHNVGFMVVDRLVEELRVTGYGLQQGWKGSTKGKLQYIWFEIKGEKLELIKPQIYMNKSGISIAYVYKSHPELKHDDIYIVHDDLDLRLGSYKIQKGKGPKEHKGLLSIYNELVSSDFWHVRVGIDNRIKRSKVKGRKSKVSSGEDYVLQNFTKDELKVVTQVIDRIVKDLSQLTNL